MSGCYGKAMWSHYKEDLTVESSWKYERPHGGAGGGWILRWKMEKLNVEGMKSNYAVTMETGEDPFQATPLGVSSRWEAGPLVPWLPLPLTAAHALPAVKPGMLSWEGARLDAAGDTDMVSQSQLSSGLTSGSLTSPHYPSKHNGKKKKRQESWRRLGPALTSPLSTVGPAWADSTFGGPWKCFNSF